MRTLPVPAVVMLSLAAIGLGGCAAASDKYPSLAVRDAERVKGSFEVPPAPEPSPLPAATLTNVESMVERARVSHIRFVAAVPAAWRAVGSASGNIESDSWASAQVALADLDSMRSDTAIALGDLDLAFTDATLSFTQRAAIGEARSKVVELVSEEDRLLADLRGAMPR